MHAYQPVCVHNLGKTTGFSRQLDATLITALYYSRNYGLHTHTPALHCAVVPVRPSPPAPPRPRHGNTSCNTQSDIFAQEAATQPWRLASRSQASHASSMRCAALLGVQNRRYPRSRVWACAPCTQHAAVHAAARAALCRAAQPVHVDTNHPQSRTQLACIPRLPVPGARRGLSKRRWRSTCASWRP